MLASVRPQIRSMRQGLFTQCLCSLLIPIQYTVFINIGLSFYIFMLYFQRPVIPANFIDVYDLHTSKRDLWSQHDHCALHIFLIALQSVRLSAGKLAWLPAGLRRVVWLSREIVEQRFSLYVYQLNSSFSSRWMSLLTCIGDSAKPVHVGYQLQTFRINGKHMLVRLIMIWRQGLYHQSYHQPNRSHLGSVACTSQVLMYISDLFSCFWCWWMCMMFVIREGCWACRNCEWHW